MATKAGLRQIWFQVHKWIGIILAIVLIPLSISGSLLVWKVPLDRMLHPARHETSGPPALPAAAYLAVAMKALPAGARASSLVMPGADEPVIVTAAVHSASGASAGPPQRLSAWLDPASGKLLETGPAADPVERFFHRFHGSLLVPGVGRSIVGWLGVLMTISCLTGIWLWWPMAGRLARAFRWRRQPDLDTNLHHMVGFWVAVPLALLSVTGVLISFPRLTGGGQPPRAAAAQAPRTVAGAGGAERTTPNPPPRGGRRPDPAPLATTRLTVTRAIAASGFTAGPYTVTWPTETEASWRVAGGGLSPRTVSVDDGSGTAGEARPGRGRPLVRRLHDGTGMGLLFQAIIVLGGIGPAALGITGITMWLRTRRWRGDVARRRKDRRRVPAAAS